MKFWQARWTRVLKLTHFLDCGSTISEPIATLPDKLLLHPIVTVMDWKSLSDNDHDRKRVFQLGHWALSEAHCKATYPTTSLSSHDKHHDGTKKKFDRKDVCKRVLWSRTRSSTLIVMMLANELVNCDEGRMKTFVNHDEDREWVSWSQWILQMSRFGCNNGCDEPCKFECNESCNELWHVWPRWRLQQTR